VCLDIADVVREMPTILRKKIEDPREAGATRLHAAASRRSNRVNVCRCAV
jgi:hypothetical protein